MCGLSTVVTPAGASLTMYREIRSYANSIWDDNNNNNNNPTLYAPKKLSGLFEKFPKVQLKKKGGNSGPGCRASKLLDFRPLLHLFLEAVSLRPEKCWLFILRMHFHIGSGQCIVSLYFHFI